MSIVTPLIVRVFTMIKNEGDLLDRWITHYRYLFGYENLTILDNGSDDKKTLQILAQAELKGVRVIYNYNQHNHFMNKGDIIKAIAEQDFAEGIDYDFLLPVDCDEFLSVFTHRTITSDPVAVHTELRRYLNIDTSLLIDMSLENCPGQEHWYAPNFSFRKTMLPRGEIGRTDDGFHWWDLKDNPTATTTTNLTYLHHHNPDFMTARKKAALKLQSLVDVKDKDALREYASRGGAHGCHLIPLMLMTKKEYMARYDENFKLKVGFPMELQVPGHNAIFWNGDQYLHAHPDVNNYEQSSLHHYVRHGHKEGRIPIHKQN